MTPFKSGLPDKITALLSNEQATFKDIESLLIACKSQIEILESEYRCIMTQPAKLEFKVGPGSVLPDQLEIRDGTIVMKGSGAMPSFDNLPDGESVSLVPRKDLQKLLNDLKKRKPTTSRSSPLKS